MRLLVTRPEPDNARTAAALRARGHAVVLAPLLRIEAVPDAELGAGPFAAVLLTSANAARAIAEHRRVAELRALPVLAVGRGSAAAARALGFADVVSAEGDAGDLVRLVSRRFAGVRAPLLHPTGEDRARDVAAELAALGLGVRTVVVYRAAKAEALPAEAQTALDHGRLDGVLHFSRRSVENYLECAAGRLDRALAPVHYCLSARAAEPLRAAGAADIRVAARPDEATLLDLVASQR